jgi:hypothetical protein
MYKRLKSYGIRIIVLKGNIKTIIRDVSVTIMLEIW